MKIIFRIHAIQRMFERSISAEDVRAIFESGETIEDYPDDTPYPSRLILGRRGKRPLHIVGQIILRMAKLLSLPFMNPMD